MIKKILLSIILILLLIAVGYKIKNKPDNNLKLEIESNNEQVGELEIEEEFLGPNTNYSRNPDSPTEKFINF